MLKTRSRRAATIAIGVAGFALVGASFALTNAVAAPRAAFTTVNSHFDGGGHCHNGNPQVNCNIYDGARYVWLNGGPAVAELGDGTYLFAVLQPGGQPDPNDGSPRLLSTDPYTNRIFSVVSGTMSYNGTHAFDQNKIRLIPFAETPNNSGENILAICRIDNGVPVSPRDCKYDAFKVAGDGSTDTTTPQGSTTTTRSSTSSTTTISTTSSTTTTTPTGESTTTTPVESPTTTIADDTTSTTKSTSTTTTVPF